MNIDEIRAEAKGAFASLAATQRWIGDKLGIYELDGDTNCEIAANLLVDWAYEAGKADSEVEWIAQDMKTREEMYARGYEAAAKDPKAWYVLDKNGEPLHLENKVKTSEGILTITSIRGDIEPTNCLVLASDDNGEWEFKPWKIEKVIPDTRERIISDLVRYARAGHGRETSDELVKQVEQFIARVEALERD